MEQLGKVINEESKVYSEGANKAFELPEFKSLEVARNFVNLIDTKQVMVDLLNTGFAQDINVYIGDESKIDSDVTVIKTRYKANGEEGTIAIIGPKRMEYDKVITLLDYIKKNIEDEQNEKEI